MTAKELIAELQQLTPDEQDNIVIDGNSGRRIDKVVVYPDFISLD